MTKLVSAGAGALLAALCASYAMAGPPPFAPAAHVIFGGHSHTLIGNARGQACIINLDKRAVSGCFFGN